MRCQACRRTLTNPASIKHQLGPDCLRKAVAAGTAPLEALEELRNWQQSRPKQPKRTKEIRPAACGETLDLFEQLRVAALDDLNKAADTCRSVGIAVTITIE